MLCCAASCYARLCRAVLCRRAMPCCGAVSCCAVLCDIGCAKKKDSKQTRLLVAFADDGDDFVDELLVFGVVLVVEGGVDPPVRQQLV